LVTAGLVTAVAYVVFVVSFGESTRRVSVFDNKAPLMGFVEPHAIHAQQE